MNISPNECKTCFKGQQQDCRTSKNARQWFQFVYWERLSSGGSTALAFTVKTQGKKNTWLNSLWAKAMTLSLRLSPSLFLSLFSHWPFINLWSSMIVFNMFGFFPCRMGMLSHLSSVAFRLWWIWSQRNLFLTWMLIAPRYEALNCASWELAFTHTILLYNRILVPCLSLTMKFAVHSRWRHFIANCWISFWNLVSLNRRLKMCS